MNVGGGYLQPVRAPQNSNIPTFMERYLGHNSTVNMPFHMLSCFSDHDIVGAVVSS